MEGRRDRESSRKNKCFVNVVTTSSLSLRVMDVWRLPQIELLATERKSSTQWISCDRNHLPLGHIIQQQVRHVNRKKSLLACFPAHSPSSAWSAFSKVTVQWCFEGLLWSSCRAVKFHGIVLMLIDWLIETDQKIYSDFLLRPLRCNSLFPFVSLEIASHPEENVSVTACSEVSFHIIF